MKKIGGILPDIFDVFTFFHAAHFPPGKGRLNCVATRDLTKYTRTKHTRTKYTGQNISGQNIPDKIYQTKRTRTKYAGQYNIYRQGPGGYSNLGKRVAPLWAHQAAAGFRLPA